MSAAERATAQRASAKAIFGAPAIVLGLLCAMYFITYVDRVNIATAATAIKTDFGLNNTELGRALGASDLVLIAICLSGSFFCLELTIGPIWSVPMDVAPKFAGTASGIMNTGSAIAGFGSPVIFGWWSMLPATRTCRSPGRSGSWFSGHPGFLDASRQATRRVTAS